jgi:predicted RNA-binding Zn-ribbon protein involved in translation (DUF1610 family)
MSTDRLKEYTDHFSKEYSKDILEFAVRTFPDYIFTRRVKKQQFGFCTACKKEFKTSGLKHKASVKCPKCGEDVIIQSSGMGRGYMINETYFIYYEKSAIDPEAIVARGVHAVEDYRKDYKHVKPLMTDRTLYIFKIGEAVMLKRYTWYSWREFKFGTPCWGSWRNFAKTATVHSELGVWAKNNWKRGFACYSRDSISKAIEGTPFRYSMWESYQDEPMIKFFELYCKYSLAVEYLTKLDLVHLIDAKLTGNHTCGAINWKGKTVFQMLRINRAELKALRESKYGMTPFFLRLFQINKKYKGGMELADIAEAEKEFATNQINDLNLFMKYTTLKKAFDYMKVQQKLCKSPIDYKQYHSIYNVSTDYKDYLSDCIALDYDLTKKSVLFPKNLYNAHQNTISQVKIKANEHLNETFIKREKVLLEKYGFQYRNLVIRPAQSPAELILEGKALNHCVGTYADRHAKGEISIFFIRKSSDLDKPYYTLELRQDRIIQTRGKNNINPDEAVEEFLKVFTEEKLSKKKADNRVKITVPA